MLEILEQYSHVVMYNCRYVMLEILEQYSHEKFTSGFLAFN